jgi:very-short-patch-repair endonuclease
LELSIQSDAEYESPLEIEVANEIRTLGYDVVPQVGCSDYRIDLAVVDPEKPGQFILGVECDGAMYHSACTARDRDRIRQEVLENLGWRIHRIWAPDFVARRDAEVRRLKEAIDLARQSTEESSHRESGEKNNELEQESIMTTVSSEKQNPGWATYYNVHVPQFRIPQYTQFHDSQARNTLSQLLEKIVNVEGPLHVKVASRRLAQAWRLQRIGYRMDEAIDNAILHLTNSSKVKKRGKFLWPFKEVRLTIRKPKPDDPRTIRNVQHIPPEEIELAFTKILEDALSMPREALTTEVGRIFGIERITMESRSILDEVLDALMRKGSIIDKEGRIELMGAK